MNEIDEMVQDTGMHQAWRAWGLRPYRKQPTELKILHCINELTEMLGFNLVFVTSIVIMGGELLETRN